MGRQIDPGPAVGTTVIAQPTDVSVEAETGSIAGTVSDDELVPLANATVRLSHLDALVITAVDGSFQFLQVPVGKHVVEAQAPGYAGHSTKIDVNPGEASSARFMLHPLAIIEPRVEVVQKTILMHALGPGYLIPSNDPATCSDKCQWWFTLPNASRHVLLEVAGHHSTPNPLGWDGMGLVIEGYPLKDSVNRNVLRNCGGLSEPRNESCLRLPLRIPLLDEALRPGTRVPAADRLRLYYGCDPTWFCLEERYDTFASSFIDWEGEEIPPGYSALPGG